MLTLQVKQVVLRCWTFELMCWLAADKDGQQTAFSVLRQFPLGFPEKRVPSFIVLLTMQPKTLRAMMSSSI